MDDFLLPGKCQIWACKKSALPAADGNTLNRTVSTISGTSSSETDSFGYDGQQRLAEMISYGTNPPLTPTFADTVTLQYDASGRVLSWTSIVGGLGKVVTYELSYDALGRLVTDSIFAQHLVGIPSAGIMAYDNWTYDETGNAIADEYFASSNANLIGAPFAAGVTTNHRYDNNHVNPYYHAGIPFFCNAYQGAQLLSPNNGVGDIAYYSNGRPRIESTPVYGATGTATQTTAFFYQ